VFKSAPYYKQKGITMKIIYTLIILFIASQTMADEWVPLKRSLYEYSVSDIAIADEERIVAVGEFGSIYKVHLNVSGDEDTEYIQASENWGKLNDVEYIKGAFYTVGNNGLMFISDSSGNVWSLLQTDITEDLIAVGFIENELLLVSESSIYSYDVGSSKHELLYSGNDIWNDILFENNKIYGVGDNGLLFTYDLQFGYQTYDSGVDTDISVLFSDDSGNIYFTPDNSYIMRADSDLNIFEELDIRSPFGEVWAADINQSGKIMVFGLLNGMVHAVVDTNTRELHYSNFALVSPTINKINYGNGHSFYVGAEGSIGYIFDELLEPGFKGFNALFHVYNSNYGNRKLQQQENHIDYYSGSFGRINDLSGEVDTLLFNSNGTASFDHYIGRENEKHYVFNKFWTPNNVTYPRFSYVVDDSIYHIDTASSASQRLGYFENDNYVYAFGNRLIYRANKKTFDIEEIDPGRKIDAFIKTDDSEYYGINFDTILKSNNMVDWEAVARYPLKFSQLAYSEGNIYIIGSVGNSFNDTMKIYNVLDDKLVFQYYTGKGLNFLNFYGSDIGMGNGFNNLFAYSTDGGKSWTADSIEGAFDIRSVVRLGNHLLAYSRNDIYIKPIISTSVEEETNTLIDKTHIYPNPTLPGQLITIKSLGNKNRYRYKIIDQASRIVFEAQGEGNSILLPTNLATGNYLLTISQGVNLLAVEKLIIN
jgi:hypothetical protein